MKLFARFRRVLAAVIVAGLLVPTVTASAYNYTVAPGDSLLSISQKTNTSIQQIKEVNSLSTETLNPGHVLIIPDQPAGNPQPAIPNYTVKQGDSLFTIAQKHNIQLEALLVANSISGTLIFPGQQLIIPVASSRSAGAMMQQVSRSATRPMVPFTDEEFDLLARLVNAEAGGQPMEAQIGVAAVVINRVISSKFPNTIKEVIYAPNQFGPVRNGAINRPVTEKAIEATREALHGADPTNGSLYFFDTSTRNTFLRSLPVMATYGHMIYASAK